MAKGSARQRKKIAKKLALQQVQIVHHPREQHIQHKIPKPRPTNLVNDYVPKISTEIPQADEQPVKKIGVQKRELKKRKIKKLNRKQRKRIKLQQRAQQRRVTGSKSAGGKYRDKAQRKYYEENVDKEYTNEAVDMTEEFATNIVNELNALPNDYQRNILLDIFYANYRIKGADYLRKLYETANEHDLHDVVEVAIAQYKGAMPERVFMSVAQWLNNGAPLDARNTGADFDFEDISSEFYG